MSAVMLVWGGGAVALLSLLSLGAREDGERLEASDIALALFWPLALALDLAEIVRGWRP